MYKFQSHILIAEDETHTRFTLSLILRKTGYKVTATDNGHEALEIIEDHKNTNYPIALLITDVQMAGLNGVDLIEEMEKKKMVIPILVITGYGYEEKVYELSQRENIECIDKPFDPQELVSRVEHVLESLGKEEEGFLLDFF